MKEIVEAGYDEIAERYLDWSLESDWPGRRRYLGYLLTALPESGDVLELGCGAGLPVTRALLDAGHRVTAVDISASQLELARRNVPEARLVKADITEVDLPEASFDGVCAFYSLTHVPRELHEALLRRIASWLRPRGVFVASLGKTDNPSQIDEDWLGAPMFFSHFAADAGVALVEGAGFEIARQDFIPQVEHGVEGGFLWVLARSS
jgi:SAM-dependent methyltransferase